MPPRISDRQATALVLATFTLVFTALQWFGYTQKSATWDEPIHLTTGYAALAYGDYRVESTHPPFIRMWAALPLLFMRNVRFDSGAIGSRQDAAVTGGSCADLIDDNDRHRSRRRR